MREQKVYRKDVAWNGTSKWKSYRELGVANDEPVLAGLTNCGRAFEMHQIDGDKQTSSDTDALWIMR